MTDRRGLRQCPRGRLRMDGPLWFTWAEPGASDEATIRIAATVGSRGYSF